MFDQFLSLKGLPEAVSFPADVLQYVLDCSLSRMTHDFAITMLNLTRNRDASEPRDKIYALYGMLARLPSFVDLIKPTYNISPATLYARFTYQLAVLSPTLEILELVERRAVHSNVCAESGICLPSWVPDYSTPSQVWIREKKTLPGVRQRSEMKDDGDVSLMVKLTEMGRLRLWGRSIDHIKHVGQHMTGNLNATAPADESECPSVVLGEWFRLVEGLVPTTFSSRHDAIIALIYLLRMKPVPHDLWDEEEEDYSLPITDQFLESLLGLCTQYVDLMTSGSQYTTGWEEELELKVAGVVYRLRVTPNADGIFRFTHWQGIPDNVDWSLLEPMLRDLVQNLLINMHGLALFITDIEEAIGFCSGNVRIGDEIVLCLKAERPFVVRPLEDGGYVFVGTVYMMEIPDDLWPMKKDDVCVEMIDLD